MDTKFGTNVSNRMLLNVAKFQGYIFYCFLVIEGKPTVGGGGGKITSPPQTQLRVKSKTSPNKHFNQFRMKNPHHFHKIETGI